MLLVAQLKLLPSPDQANNLADTEMAFRSACNLTSGVAFASGKKTPAGLQPLVYRDIRSRFGLGAQSACLVVRTVCAAYTSARANKNFRARPDFARTATVYDLRNLSIDQGTRTASLWTTAGRAKMPYRLGPAQEGLLSSGKWKQADLVRRGGEWFLLVSVEVDDVPAGDCQDFIGVDLGVNNIASDSDGHVHSGSAVKAVRHRHRSLRKKLQKKRTKSAKRLLKKLAGKERRYATWVNHNISKGIVQKASGTARGIAVENLTGIRERVTARKRQRAVLHSWSFGQLRHFIEYKSAKMGVRVVSVDPAYTSRTCPQCGCREKANRPSQSAFRCVQCGHSGNADLIAAENIRRAAVNRPYADALGLQSPRL